MSPSLAAHSLVLPLSGACPSTPGAAVSELATEVTKLKVVVSGVGMERMEAEGGRDNVTMDDIPVGPERTVGLYGFGNAPAAAWRGMTRHVQVEDGKPAQVDVLLARIADLTCARNAHVDKRTFHTATMLKDGRVLLVGGAREDADAQQTCGAGCRHLQASGSAEVYDPTVGTFAPVAPLTVPRMFHTATLLDDGRVVIAGGAAEAVAVAPDSTNPFPLRVTSTVSLVEVFDPTRGVFVGAGDDPAGPRVFAASTLTGDGAVIITGGIPASAANNDLGNALDTTTTCSANPLRCAAGPRMSRPRAGHMAFRLDTGDVVLWGGSVDVTAVGSIDGFQLESLRPGSSGFQMISTAGMNNDRNLFFAASSQYVPFRVLAAGGLVRGADGGFRLATVKTRDPLNPSGPSVEVNRAPVLVYDATALGSKGGIAVGNPDQEPMSLTSPRFLAAAAALPGGKRAIVVGGFSDLMLKPSDGLSLFDELQLLTVPLAVGGVPRTLRQPRGGLTAMAIGDGTVLISGGETATAEGRTPLDTSEIFADPQDPKELR